MKNFVLKLSVFLLFVACKSQIADIENERPNVLFIIIDDLNDYQGVYGGHPQAKTPNIDALANAATVFTNAHTNVPVCTPSRNSLFTGVYPHNSRDFGWTPHFKHVVLKNHKTFIELFKENGYATYGTGKLLHKNIKNYWTEWGVPEGINYGPHAYSGIDEKGKRIMGHSSVPQPFRDVNSVDGSFASLADIPVIPDGNDGYIKTGWTYGNKPFKYENDNIRDLMPDEMHAQWIKEKINALDKQSNDQPFFMGVGIVNPHTPLYAPQKYFDLFPLEAIQLPEIKKNDIEDTHYASVYPPSEMGLHYFEMLKASYENDEEGLKRFLQAYLACVAFMDDQIGTILTALNNSRFKDNTIVVLTSDHGWQMGEKDYLYKNAPWEESTRIPFIVKMPGQKSHKSVEQPVSLIDLYPSFVDVCNLKGSYKKDSTTFNLEGHSIKPLIYQHQDSWEGPNGALTVLGAGINKPIEGIGFISNPKATWHIEIKKDLDASYVLEQNYTYRTKNWRYVLYRNGKEELYYHPDDPFEWVNLADNKAHNATRSQLKNEMLEIITKNYR